MLDRERLKKQMEPFFRPRSVAVIGATNNLTKWGSWITGHILSGGFEGALYPVHPRDTEVLGRKAYAKVTDIPGPVDLAFITIPAVKVAGALEECAAKGIRAAVVITSDFSETGDEGTRREEEIVEVARSHGMRVIGPNTMGITSTEVTLHAIGAPVTPTPGNIAFLSQSGNLGTQMLYWAAGQGVGICRFVGTGNEADLSLSEILAYLGDDPCSKVILIYLEGVTDGREFLEVAREVARAKPVIVLKGGRTEAGGRAAVSHTGSLAGTDAVFRGALRQAGVIRVDNPSDLVEMAGAFTELLPPKGNRVGIVTLGGGWGVVTADLCAESGFELPPLPDDLIAEFDGILPAYWSKGNPVDLVGFMDLNLHIEIIEKMVASDRYDAVMTMGSLGASGFARRMIEDVVDITAALDEQTRAQVIERLSRREMRFLHAMRRFMHQYDKPVLTVSLEGTGRMICDLDNGDRYAVFPTPEKAVRALEKLYEYHRFQMRER